MYDLIQSGKPIDPGRVSLIRTAIEFAFRSAIYCDIIERVKALEKAQRQNQPAGDNPRPTPARSQPQNGAARVRGREKMGTVPAPTTTNADFKGFGTASAFGAPPNRVGLSCCA